jgi:metallo-beta-lactamase class B
MVLAALLSHLFLAKNETWSQPNKPYRIAGNIYQVGTKGIGVYLVTSSKGHILLDAATEKGAEVVEANIKSLGFKLSDIKFLIESHAHYDHVGGMARLKSVTGAKLVAMAGDKFALEHGTMDSDHEDKLPGFKPVKVDRLIVDGGTLQLGEIKLTAHATSGHTKGDTSWTMVVRDPKIQKGKPLRVIFYGSTSVAGNQLIGNKKYPNIVRDYRRTFAFLKTLKADIFLANHPEFADLAEKRTAQLAGKVDAFVKPGEFAAFVKDSAESFEETLAEQRKKNRNGDLRRK